MAELMSRRDFLKNVGVSAAAAAVVRLSPYVPDVPGGVPDSIVVPDRPKDVVKSPEVQQPETTAIFPIFQLTASEMGAVNTETPIPTSTATPNPDGSLTGAPVSEAGSPFSDLLYGTDAPYGVAGALNGETWTTDIRNYAEVVSRSGGARIVLIDADGEAGPNQTMAAELLDDALVSFSRVAGDGSPLPSGVMECINGTLVVLNNESQKVSFIQPAENTTAAIVRVDEGLSAYVGRYGVTSPIGSLAALTYNNTDGTIATLVTDRRGGPVPESDRFFVSPESVVYMSEPAPTPDLELAIANPERIGENVVPITTVPIRLSSGRQIPLTIRGDIAAWEAQGFGAYKFGPETYRIIQSEIADKTLRDTTEFTVLSVDNGRYLERIPSDDTSQGIFEGESLQRVDITQGIDVVLVPSPDAVPELEGMSTNILLSGARVSSNFMYIEPRNDGRLVVYACPVNPRQIAEYEESELGIFRELTFSGTLGVLGLVSLFQRIEENVDSSATPGQRAISISSSYHAINNGSRAPMATMSAVDPQRSIVPLARLIRDDVVRA